MPPPLTVIVPAYSEAACGQCLATASGRRPYADKQIVVVDDGSTDGTTAALARWASVPGVLVLRHPVNRGKGTAVRTALQHAHGTVTLIQDADLEYDPNDYGRLVEPILRHEAIVVYGSRYLDAEGLPGRASAAG